MAYFLPSYFQKRLLRYALSRLDFIETEDLDLDNLGITLGQRSVVELKNVAIKVKNIIDRLQLPPTIQLRSASIRLLRLTIPADLHASGIEVEVDGVDVTAKVISDEQGDGFKVGQTRQASTPSRTEKANRPRTSSPPIHDPGGYRTSRGHGRPLELSQVIPSPQELAMSFLQSEPVQERQELEAVIDSQSVHMQDSAMSSELGDDTGLGMPGGLTLPTFVASFFRGVADRLSVKLKNIAIRVELSLSGTPAGESDTVPFMLRVASVDVGVSTTEDMSNIEASLSRVIKITGLDFGILAEQDSLSMPSSPKLTRSPIKLPDVKQENSGEGQLSSFEGNSTHSPHLSSTPPLGSTLSESPPANELSESSILFPPTQRLALDESIDLTPQVSVSRYDDSSISTSDLAYRSPSPIDNMAHAEDLAKSGRLSPTATHESELRRDSEGLYESRLFTHDEAESMYMSAVTTGMAATSIKTGMPGAWDWSDDAQEHSDHVPGTQDLPSVPQDTMGVAEEATKDEAGWGTPLPGSLDTASPVHATPENQMATATKQDSDGLCFLRLVRISSILVTVPKPGDTLHRETAIRLLVNPVSSLPEESSHLRASSIRDSPSHVSQMRGMTMSSAPQPRAEAQQPLRTIEVQIEAIDIDLDMNICKTAVRVVQTVQRLLPKLPAPVSVELKSAKRMPDIQVTMQEAHVRFCEAVSRQIGVVSSNAQAVPSILEEPLLHLSLISVDFISLNTPSESQRFRIAKVSLHHSAKEVMSFVDSVNVRDSISSSSMLRPHDLVLTSASGRTEVQIKPIHVVLDLPVIDDVLSRSGGLSSLLDLGNSVAQLGIGKNPESKPNTSVAQRTVRFNAPQQRPRSDSDASQGPKINLRLSGSVIDLVGSEASIQIKTSAVKVVYRSSNIRVVIDGAAIEGPITPKVNTAPPLYVKIRTLEVQYAESPEENDLDRLLSLLTPSGDKYDKDDDIMVDTLLRQRRKAAVLRVNLGEIQAGGKGLTWQEPLIRLSDELARLSSVTKYLPEDDRPGILMFVLVNKFDMRFEVDAIFGPVGLKAELLEATYIPIPSLTAAQISSWSIHRGKDVLIGEVISAETSIMGPPMLMCRFIADEMDPTIRFKLTNTCVEYKVPVLVAITDLLERRNLDAQSGKSNPLAQKSSPTSSATDAASFARKTKLSIKFRDSAIALNPVNSLAKGLFLLTDAEIGHASRKQSALVTLDLKKASLLIIDTTESINEERNIDHKLYFDQNDQIQQLTKSGFVPVGSISSASATVKILEEDSEQKLDVEFRNNLLYLETCADSTQTLFQILGSLAPPSPPSKIAAYRTEIIPIQDMLASFTGNAFVSEAGPELGMQASRTTASTTSIASDDDDEDDDGYVGGLYDKEEEDDMNDSYVESEMSDSTISASLHVAPVNITASDTADLGQSMMAHSMLDFRTDHFVTKTNVGGTAHRWDSTKNTYGLASDTAFQKSPLKIRVRDVHIIWNLFDGYDWQATRDTISQAVKDIEIKAASRRPRSSNRLSPGNDDDEESVIGDFLFNSIYIGIPANKDPRDLATAINHDIDDLISETGSYATGTTVTASPTRRQSGVRSRPSKLKLERSRQHKITFELEGVSADIVAFPPGSGEVESSLDVRVRKLEIFDHVPTSTWKKFATYMHDAGEREVDTNMVHLEWLNVKPIAELTASEIVLKVTILPLRLHVDQDALDFMTRFFEFKDDRVPASTNPPNPPFLQRVEVNPVQLKLDFKPKRVDYGGLRSGRTTEFMNFFVLDRSDMVLRRVILYGVSGFDRLGIMLNNIWSPDVRRNQLPGVLAGLAPIRPLVDVTSGVRDLIAVPIREYKKDGRVVRSIQKGAIAFAKTTATELVNLGAKLAIGTQQILQNAEGMLINTETGEEVDDEVKKQISLYADQPIGIVQGLRGAYASLERDLLLARDAIVAVPGEVMASGSATGAARAVLKQSPTIILRPAIGASKAVGQTLLGAGNTLDRKNLRRMEEKYKRH